MENFLILLSICVPTYNRAKELSVLLSSIPDADEIEVVVVDDGSSDTTFDLVQQQSGQRTFTLCYFRQTNKGRAHALVNALRQSSGEYTMIMDSDDIFLPGWWESVRPVLIEGGSSFVFGTHLLKNEKMIINLPPETDCTLLSLRADMHVQGDLKEIVSREILIECLYDYPESVRRVPTSLIWARVSNLCETRAIPYAIAQKEYLPGGMTDIGFQLRMESSLPMRDLNGIIATSRSYSSFFYRIKAMLQWGRYSHHVGNIRLEHYWQYIFYLPGLALCLFDRCRSLEK